MEKDTNIFTSLYSRFCEWVNNAKKESLVHRRGSHSDRRSRSGSGSGSHIRGGHADGSQTPLSPEEQHRCHHTSVSSEDSDLSSFYVASYSSTCSNLTLTSTSTTISDCTRPYDPWAYSPTFHRLSSVGADHRGYCNGPEDDPYDSPLTPDYDFYPPLKDTLPISLNSGRDSCFSSPSVGLEYDRDSVIQSLDQKTVRTKRSRFGRTKHPSVSIWVGQGQKEDIQKHFLCATWPPTNRRKHSLGKYQKFTDA